MNKVDEEFDRIVHKDIKEKIAVAFVDIDCNTRVLNEEQRREILQKKANQLKTEVCRHTDLLLEEMLCEKSDKNRLEEYSGQGEEEQPKDAIQSINRTIATLSDHITKCINEGKAMENEIAELTKALAELVYARANIG